VRACALIASLGAPSCPTTPSHAAEPSPPDAEGGAWSLGDFADPFVLRDGDIFYAFATGARGGDNVQVARSRDRLAWERLPDALPELPSWQRRGFTWAPSVLHRAGDYLLYYTTRDRASGFQCISLARATAPAGPYRDDSAGALICPTDMCGAIDPSPFVDDEGRGYLLWKSDENAIECNGPPRIWAQPLAPDGSRLAGPPRTLLTMDRAWEAPIIEGPSMVHRQGAYYLFYSANQFESADYAIGYAICESPLGPCRKVTLDRPLFASQGTLLGPGGQEPFEDAHGDLWVAFHAWGTDATTYALGGARRLHFARLTFGTDAAGDAGAADTPGTPALALLP
jgi:beta-xylosidase